MTRSPHASVKVLPSTPTAGSLPSGIRVARRPTPGNLALPTAFSEARNVFNNFGPPSPSLPVFARRKRSVFKGPGGVGGSPSAFGRAAGSRSNSVPRKSGELFHGITEEDEDEADETEVEEVDHFGGELGLTTSDGEVVVDEADTEPVSPLSPMPVEHEQPLVSAVGNGVPLTEEALAEKDKQMEKELAL